MTTEEQVHRAARLIYQMRNPSRDPIGGVFEGPSWAEIEMRDATATARALAEAGLLAPAPLREEWGAEMDHPIPDRPPSMIKARDLEHARWQVEHNPKVATGRIMRRYVSDWEEA